MLFNNLAKKMCVMGLCMGIAASPLAFANNSIGLNKDRSAGHEVIVKPQSHATLRTDTFTKNDLLYDKGDRQTDQKFMTKKSEYSVKGTTTLEPADLVIQR